MLKVDQISTFYGKVQALDRASIEVGENEIVSMHWCQRRWQIHHDAKHHGPCSSQERNDYLPG